MLKRVTMLAVAMFAVGALSARAQTDRIGDYRADRTGERAGERPSSLDRHLAPDDYPTNVVKILRTTNKAQTNSYVPVVFNMSQNNPFNVIRMLRVPVRQEEGLLFTFVNPDGRSGKVLYVVPQYMIPQLEALVRSLDIPGMTTSANDTRIYRQLKHRRADSSDQGFLDTAASFSTGNGSTFIADPENNALFWEDAGSGAGALDGALSTWLDVPTAMVQLVVKIYELDSYNDASIGQDYQAWKNSLGQNLFAVGAYSEYGSIGRVDDMLYPPLDTGALGLPKNNFSASGYNYAYEYKTSSAFFDFLQSKGKARVMNKAKLAILNTYTGSVSAGDQVLYYAVQSSDPSGVRDTGGQFDANGGRTVVGTTQDIDTLTPVETGLSIEVTPTIGEQSVTLDLSIDWSDYTGFSADGFPQINPRSLSSRLRMAVGDETVIGGLSRQVRVDTTEKVPFLGSLPILGYVFGGESDTNKNTEMIVAIQPIGIMKYDMAGGTMVAKDDKGLIDKATGAASVAPPASNWGFDMLGMDHAMTIKPQGLK